MRLPIILLITITAIVLGIWWYRGNGLIVLQLLPNSCDPGNQRLHALEADSAAKIEIAQAELTRRVPLPASSISIKSCDSATLEIDYHSNNPSSTYESLKAELLGRGWSLVSEGPTIDGRPFSSYDKTINGWNATLDMSSDQDTAYHRSQVIIVMRAPPIHE